MNEVSLLAPVHARTSIKNMGYEYGKSSLKIWNLSKDSLEAYLSNTLMKIQCESKYDFEWHLPNTLKEIWKK